MASILTNDYNEVSAIVNKLNSTFDKLKLKTNNLEDTFKDKSNNINNLKEDSSEMKKLAKKMSNLESV